MLVSGAVNGRTLHMRQGREFKVGDHVSWNSEAGRVRGRIVRVHTRDVNYKGYVHHASREDPQYEIKSDKTEHVALHKGRTLRRLSW
jgi:Hypervirulence associated proteins TUDOR domain